MPRRPGRGVARRGEQRAVCLLAGSPSAALTTTRGRFRAAATTVSLAGGRERSPPRPRSPATSHGPDEPVGARRRPNVAVSFPGGGGCPTPASSRSARPFTRLRRRGSCVGAFRSPTARGGAGRAAVGVTVEVSALGRCRAPRGTRAPTGSGPFERGHRTEVDGTRCLRHERNAARGHTRRRRRSGFPQSPPAMRRPGFPGQTQHDLDFTAAIRERDIANPPARTKGIAGRRLRGMAFTEPRRNEARGGAATPATGQACLPAQPTPRAPAPAYTSRQRPRRPRAATAHRPRARRGAPRPAKHGVRRRQGNCAEGLATPIATSHARARRSPCRTSVRARPARRRRRTSAPPASARAPIRRAGTR